MKSAEQLFPAFASKMRQAGVSEAAIRAFEGSFSSLLQGNTGTISESEIEPVSRLPHSDEMDQDPKGNASLLSQTAVIKLNGGLGTSMGLDAAKSLLTVKPGLTFLDIIVRHVLHLRKSHRVPLRLLFMNSFSTAPDTRRFLANYPELGPANELELLQNQVPKVNAQTFLPVTWESNPQLEWCPPGHGDIYPSLLGSGWLDRLLKEGVQFLFVSNADNLGASVDPGILSYFAASGKPFLMEVAERTPGDRKGGHLAMRNGRFLLRESAQCTEEDAAAFQDIQKYRFFNTNNLWIRLDSLREALEQHGGYIPLPLIRNTKTVDPRDKNSPRVYQLEHAMGAAIEKFEGAGALVVPRSRFAPVKTTADLLGLRSDAYEITSDWRVVLASDRAGKPPRVELDGDYYQIVDQLEEKLAAGAPSLRECTELSVTGPVVFNPQNVFRGKVTLLNRTARPALLEPGIYEDCTVDLQSAAN